MSEGMEAAVVDGAGDAAPEQTNEAKLPANNNLPDRDAEEHELSVSGEKRKITFAEMKKLLGKELTADKRLQEAAQTKRETEELKKNIQAWFEELKKDAPRALKNAGLNPKEVFQKALEEEARRGLMSPEELEREEMRAENARLKQESELSAKEKEEMRREKQELWEKQQGELHAPVVEQQLLAAAAKVGLPKNPWALEQMVNEIYETKQKYDMDVSIEQAAILANHRIKVQGQKDRQEFYANVDGDEIIKDLGPEVLKKIWEASRRQASNNNVPKQTNAVAPRVGNQRGYISEIDLAKKWR